MPDSADQQMTKDKGQMTTLAITGVAGRMGQRLVALAHADADLSLVGAIERGGHAAIARDAGEVAGVGPIGLAVSDEMPVKPQVLIDFTAPAALRHWLKVCRDRGIAVVIGTTGLSDADHAAIDQAAADVAVLQAP